MKPVIKRIWNYMEGVNGLLLILYCIFSFSAYAFFIADTSVMFFLRRTFLPYSSMCGMYPVLDKWPVLLPFAWVHRILDVLLHRRENAVRIANAKVNEEDARHVRRLMDNFGLSEQKQQQEPGRI